MASPVVPVSSDALDQWRPDGDRLSFKDVAWSGGALAIVMHASLHFFSVAIPSLEHLLAVFGPPEHLAYGLTRNLDPLATWMVMLLAVAAWGALSGVAILAFVHEATDLVRRVLRPAR
jgi:hypothetical protein